MGKKLLVIFSALLLLGLISSSIASSYGDTTKPAPRTHTKKTTYATKDIDVVVEGVVYCQSCNYTGTWSLNEAKPINGALVGVICRNYKDRVTFYKTFQTTAEGYFYAELKGFDMKHPLLDHPLQSCSVKLVSSPDDDCNVFTNLNYGINGASFRYEEKRTVNKGYEAVIYEAGPLAFRSDHCPPKDY